LSVGCAAVLSAIKGPSTMLLAMIAAIAVLLAAEVDQLEQRRS
jgi:hypothetical protein